jgi:hypothetical protein
MSSGARPGSSGRFSLISWMRARRVSEALVASSGAVQSAQLQSKDHVSFMAARRSACGREEKP